jgi:hypothetical protein
MQERAGSPTNILHDFFGMWLWDRYLKRFKKLEFWAESPTRDDVISVTCNKQ